MGIHQATIKDIASRLKISVSTVSRALRGSPDISDDTRKLVLAVAEEMNYSPNPVALSLREKRTKVIGVIVQEIANNYCAAVIGGIEDIAFKQGYQVLIAQSHERMDRETLDTRVLASRRVDGLLITVSNETTGVDHLKDLMSKGIPVVMFDRVSSEIDTHKVVVDDYKGAYELTAHLVNQGYKKIAHLGISSHLDITQNRLAGYLDALAAYKLPVRKNWIVHCSPEEKIMKQAVKKILTGSTRPDAIFSSMERLSMMSVKVASEMNLKVPEDIALAGFTDNPLSRYLNPSFTSVHQPTFAIGQKAAELLIELIEKPWPDVFTTFKFETSLDIQQSTAAVPGRRPEKLSGSIK